MFVCLYILIDKIWQHFFRHQLSGNIYRISEPVSPVIAKIVFKGPVAGIANHPFPEQYGISWFYIQQLADLCISQYRADAFPR